MPKSAVWFIDKQTRELMQTSLDRADRTIVDRTETVWIVQRRRESIARSRRLIAAMRERHRLD